MKNLFNKTFYKFTLGFVGILLASFTLAAIVSHLDTSTAQQPTASRGK